MSDEARTVDRYVLPERSGYYVGARIVEPAIQTRGLSWAIRAGAQELTDLARSGAADRLTAAGGGRPLLPDAEGPEDPVEHVLGVDDADQLLQCADRRAQVHRDDRRRQLAARPALAERFHLGARGAQRRQVPRPRHDRHVRLDRGDGAGERLLDPRQQLAEPRSRFRADAHQPPVAP